MPQSLSREFRLVAACCVWPPSARADDAVRAAAGRLDWARVQRVARRQRVEGLVHEALSRAGVAPPEPISAEFSARAREILREGMTQAGESLRLQRLLEAAGAPVMVLKGSAVALLAYGRLGLKSAWDIDLLVAPDNAATAHATLLAEGYALVAPADLTAGRFADWAALSKECEYRSAGGLAVELHWRLTDNPVLLTGVCAGSPVLSVDLTPGAALRTLAPAELYAYLCVHGAMHGWARLKWLADLAALLSHEAPDGVARLHDAARRLGAGACSAEALVLCQRLLATTLPADLAAGLRADRRARWLSDVALKAMGGGEGERELEDRPLHAGLVLLSHFALGTTRGYAAGELARKWIGVSDRMALPLPRALHFLYHILRLPLWLWRRLSRLALRG